MFWWQKTTGFSFWTPQLSPTLPIITQLFCSPPLAVSTVLEQYLLSARIKSLHQRPVASARVGLLLIRARHPTAMDADNQNTICASSPDRSVPKEAFTSITVSAYLHSSWGTCVAPLAGTRFGRSIITLANQNALQAPSPRGHQRIKLLWKG